MSDYLTYIKAVATGKKGNKDLSKDEAKEIISLILKQKIPTEATVAFLVGWRLKPETTDEFTGALEAFDTFIKKTNIQNSLELGYPFDGKIKTPYLLPLIDTLLKNTDLNLVVSSDDKVPAKNGITLKEIQHEIPFKHIKYFDRKEIFKELHTLTTLRNNIGIRTGLNTVEKLTKFANSDCAVTGVFHKPYVKKYLEIFKNRYKRFALLQGEEGAPEIFSKGTLFLYDKQNGYKEFEINPKRYGIEYNKSKLPLSKKEFLKLIKEPNDTLLKLARLNLAVYMFIANKYDSIDLSWEIVTSSP